jgi:hypothetical protein
MNEFNKIMHTIKNNLQESVLFIFLIIFLIIVAYFRLKIQLGIGPMYDSYDLLANAALFAGKNIGYSALRPPFLSFLTSLIFRFEGLSINPIFYLDAIIDVLGVIGLYFFFKLRFNALNSFIGSLLYFTFPIILTYVGAGVADLPSVSISIWALYFTFLAVKRDSKYFLLSFPLAMISFLTRYNQALIIFPMFLIIFVDWPNIKKQKNIIIGIILSLLILIPFLIFFTFKYGNPLYPFTNFYGTTSGPVSTQNVDYNTDLLFYIKLLPFAMGNAALTIILVIAGGLTLSWIRLVQGKKSLPHIKKTLKIKNNWKIIIILITAAIFILSLGNVPYILSEILFFILCLVSFKLLKINPNYDLDLLFISWFATFLIFNSIYPIKDVRYFLQIMPAFSYLLIRGLVLIENQIGLIKKRKLTFYLAPLLVIIIIISTSFYLPTILTVNQGNNNLNIDMAAASQYLINYDPYYKSEVIYSDLWANSGWDLQTNVQIMPEFQNNQTYIGLNDYKPNSEAANNFLVNNNAEYYFSITNGLNLTSYIPIKQVGKVIIYKRSV